MCMDVYRPVDFTISAIHSNMCIVVNRCHDNFWQDTVTAGNSTSDTITLITASSR